MNSVNPINSMKNIVANELTSSAAAPEARIFLVDDHEVVRHGLAMSLLNFLEESPQTALTVRFVGTAQTGEEALRLIPESGANVAFVDVMLPDMSGLAVMRRLRELGLGKERLRIMVVTELTSPNVREIFAAGANAYISKQERGAMFIEALAAILAEPMKSWLQPDVAQQLAKIEYTLKAYGLTPAEIDILQLLHLSNPEVAECLGITANTVRNHLANIYEKLNVNSRKDVTNFARRLGLVSIVY
jgi:DNA-binding NarL/FixJ family response regulator